MNNERKNCKELFGIDALISAQSRCTKGTNNERTGNMFVTKVQAQFTDRKPPVAGHYLNKHTKERLLKRKLEAEVFSRDSATLTYNLLYIPRILKTDLRRQYPVMFMNVYNSCDYVYMKKFMDKFFRDDTQFIFQADTHRLPIRAVSNGKENFGKAWFDRMNDAPDLCFELTSSQFRLRSDGTCTCSATFRYYGTAIVYVDPNRLPTLLSYCERREDGILIFPKSLPKSSSAGDTPRSPRTPYALMQALESNGFYGMGSEESSSDKDTEGFKILKDYSNRWNEIQVLSDRMNQLSLKHPKNLSNSSNSSLIPRDEYEYSMKMFKNEMSLIRQYPRIKSNLATVVLGIPFEFTGNFTFCLDEESRVLHNYFHTALVCKNDQYK